MALAAATASVRPSAAVVLGPSLPRFVEAVESYWRTQVTREWRDAHLEARTARRRLEELNRATALAPEDELERAGLTERFEGEDAALPAYHGLVGGPQGAYACFSVGRILLERGDDEGLRWLDRAIAAGPETALTGSTLAITV